MAPAKHTFAGPESAISKIGAPTDAYQVAPAPIRSTAVIRTYSNTDVLPPSTVEVRADATNGLAAIFMRTDAGQEFECPVSSRKAVVMAFELLSLASRNVSGLLLPLNSLRTVLATLPKT